ncbi:16S rRNA (cytosine(1402)-N(4))-methyltransferase RsmH [Chitinivibrio alkaliphilus]|uniref:Ribosomal RNA small subunit methyltransferase H n=1 Tax=Chitinivibrio alkaliphilus ACht1 TaxID=1313304 RepID=U7D3X2_9BACT|nr:16S rRNA (cytosine(1402)-N(4))-methyltransferase RsmH [Chitinivibrio alkaliphilus]ERP31204.1 S-adenosyl-methyltransferase MraW [Chitinivibrio alkaliphilus ACht1]
MSRYHTPVLLPECLELLDVASGGVFLDGTLGGGGHSLAMARAMGSEGMVIGIDRDEDALAEVSRRLKEEQIESVHLDKRCFKDFPETLHSLQISSVSGILLDLGVSSHQFDAGPRGFSYRMDAPLDMRMDRSSPLSAETVLSEYSQKQLGTILREYGEVRGAAKMADCICRYRKTMPVHTTGEFVSLLEQEYPRISPKALSKIFQALRIEVNDELAELRQVLEHSLHYLSPGGRIAVISYHSLEDRIVKNFIRSAEKSCHCPAHVPVCTCGGNNARMRALTRKPVVASSEEIARNSRARSAKLRGGVRV